MKKVFSTITMLACLTAALASCSAKDSTSDAAPATALTETATEAPAIEAPATEAEENEKSEAAASTDMTEEDFIGKWQCKDMTVNGEKMEDLFGAPAFTIFQLEFAEDKTGTFSSFLSLEPGPADITWDINEDGNITIAYKDDDTDMSDYIFKPEGDMLVLDLSDDFSEFFANMEKVDEFTPVPEDTSMGFSFSMDSDDAVGGEWEFSIDGDDISVEEVTGE